MDCESVNSQQKALVEGLGQLFSEGLLCDFNIQVDNECIAVHRCVLAASSHYFKAMLTLDTRESSKHHVTLQNIDKSVLHDLVHYFYTGDICVTSDNVQSLLTAANMLQIEGLLKLCESYMMSSLCPENCLDVFTFADFELLSDLKETARVYACNNFESIYKSYSFLELHPTIVKQLLSSDDINVSDEQSVYEALMLWINHDTEQRKRDLVTLIFSVRFPLIGINHITSTVLTDSLIKNNLFCWQLIDKFVTACQSQGTDPCEKIFCDKLRLGMHSQPMLVFSGGANSPTDRAFSCFDLESGKSFYSIQHHPSFDYKYRLDFFKLVVTDNNDIFFIGGISYADYHFESGGAVAQRDVLVYNQKDKEWKQCAPMTVPRCAFSCCYIDGKIYVFGGYTSYPGQPPLESVAFYDISMDEWTECNELPIGLAHSATAVYKDTALVFGGIDLDGQYLNTLLQYNFNEDRWALLETCLPSPAPRAEASAFVYKDRVFILGGCNHLGAQTSVNVLNMKTLRWSRASDFPVNRKFTSVCRGGDFLFVCGGVKQFSVRRERQRIDRTVESKDLYSYDLAKDVWLKKSRLNDQARNFACVYASINIKFLKENNQVPEGDT